MNQKALGPQSKQHSQKKKNRIRKTHFTWSEKVDQTRIKTSKLYGRIQNFIERKNKTEPFWVPEDIWITTIYLDILII